MIVINVLIGDGLWLETTQADFSDGTFERNLYPSHLSGGTIEFVPRFDLNNDGYIDLFSGTSSTISIYWGSQSGYSLSNKMTFATDGTGNCDAADLNNDGYPEFIASYGNNDPRLVIYWGSATGFNPINNFSLYTVSNEAVYVADCNKDGYLDLIVGVSLNYNTLSIYWGSASGYSNSNRIDLPCLYGAHNIEVGDLNKDNWYDIIIVNNNGTSNYIYWGSANGYSPGNFTTLIAPSTPHGSSIADLNGDSYLDIIFTSVYGSQSYLYYGGPNGYQNYQTLNTGSTYGGSSVLDVNNDGYLDILFFRGWPDPLRSVIYWGSASGYSDGNKTEIGTSLYGSGGFVADLNYDGYFDIFVNNRGSGSPIFWGPDYTTSFIFPTGYDHHSMFREIGNVYNRKYYEDYISSVFDAGEEVDWGVIDWDDSVPPGSNIAFFVRSGNTPNPDNSWSEWDSLGKFDEIADSLNSRYIQYRARLKYTNPSYLPFLYEVRIGYGPAVKLILEPNQADSTLPNARVDYGIRVINIGIGLDTVDLSYEHNTNWQIGLFDSTGTNPLIDHNNNTIPDVIININDTIPIALAVTPPGSAQGGEVDSLRLVGSSNINPALLDTVFITTQIRRLVAILVEPDQIGYTIAGVPKPYDLWVYNQGTNRDTVDLYYHHNKPWGIALLDSTGAPLIDHNNNGLVDLWVPSLDSVRFRCLVYSPDTAQAGESDTLILIGRSSLNPSITDSARVITIIEGVGAIIIFPDQTANGLPNNWVNFPLSCRNNQNFTDTIDLRYIDRLGFSYDFWDTLNNPLIDHNNNGLVDLPGVSPAGAEVDFNVRVLVPPNTPSGIRDTICVYGYSGRDTLVRDSSVCVLVVGTVAQVMIEPDRSDSGSCGDTIEYLLWVTNLGNAGDVIDLTIVGGDFNYRLCDLTGNLLIDTDNDGFVDVGLVSGFGGRESLWVKVVVPQVVSGVVDTVLVRAYSSNNNLVYDDVVIMTKSLGGTWGLVIEPDQSNRVELGKSVGYQLRALLQANVKDVVNIRHSNLVGNWGVDIFDSSGDPLADNNSDGMIDLDSVMPGVVKVFRVVVKAPEDFDLSGLLDTLIYFDLVVYGECSMRSDIRDSVLLRTYLVPPFEVHNFRNPFRERTQFIFSLPKSGRVNLEVYNRAGELVRRLITNRHYDFGIHYYPWDGQNDKGKSLAPGVYIYFFDFIADDGEHLIAKKKAVIIK
ncbi:MAG: FG-GAP-like repeat-containing protein [bacterium]